MCNVYGYRTDTGVVNVVAIKRGKSYRAVCVGTRSVKTLRIRPDEFRYMRPIEDYPPRRAVARFRQIGKRMGMTKQARQLLATIYKESKE